MSEKNLALSLLITAKDQATSVINNVKNSITRFAGVAVAAFAVGFFRSSIDDALQLEEQTRKLEAVIKATGGAAGVSAGQINKMFAGDDNAVAFRNAAAQLLTLKSVSKDVFETTLRLADDLADAGFGSLEQNAVQLGKALEDPVKGLTALTRSGVTFSEAEQELIKQLVETGNKAQAQGLILQAVAGQVGGVADAVGSGLTGANESLDASFRQIRESIGSYVVPALTVFKSSVAAIIGDLAKFVSSNDSATESVSKFGSVSVVLAQAAATLSLNLRYLTNETVAFFKQIGALATFDFSKFFKIDDETQQANQKAFDEINKQISDLATVKNVTITPTVNTSAVETGMAAINADVETVINQFKIWGNASTASVDNIAAELKKLSDIELENLKTTLADAFETGTNRSNELQKSLEKINAEEVARAWKTLGKESSASLKLAAKEASKAYIVIRDSGTATAVELEKAWSAYIAKILQTKAAINEVDSLEKQRKQNLADLDAIGSTPADKAEQRRRQLTQQTIDFDKAKRRGDFAEAVRIANEKEALALENARAEKQASVDGTRSSGDAYLARQKYIRAIEDTEKALDALSVAEKQQENNPEPQDESQAAKNLDDISQKVQNLNEPIQIVLTGNFLETSAQLDSILQKINAINSSSIDTGNSLEKSLSREVLKRGNRI